MRRKLAISIVAQMSSENPAESLRFEMLLIVVPYEMSGASDINQFTPARMEGAHSSGGVKYSMVYGYDIYPYIFLDVDESMMTTNQKPQQNTFFAKQQF